MMLFSMCVSPQMTEFMRPGVCLFVDCGIYISSLTQGLKDDLMSSALKVQLRQSAGTRGRHSGIIATLICRVWSK